MSATTRDAALIEAARAGDRRALSRLLTLVEAGGADADAAVQRLYHYSQRAHVVGITGSPGAGKSTLVAALAGALRLAKRTVAVVAVDPSSPFTGGALLGDRIRMAALAGDDGVFVRSMASRGAGGALAAQAGAAATVLAGAGFEVVLVETVGAGQDELAVAGEAQTTVVVTAPGGGDEIQALKAGLLEIADVLVVNKADLPGADRLVAALRFGRGVEARPHPADWTPPIVKTVATAGDGVSELVAALERHRAWRESGGSGAGRARTLAERRILRLAAARALARATDRARQSGVWPELVEAVISGRLSAPAAATALLDEGGEAER
ncbi:MAG TPA: methylmalonyl Co-A mutase-associated GTPase MeaB [Chloroflexota bacterium]|nr:methylmalonyl Co-A mutase-associated GTPase MeaB [Chloroflexota bacterium]